MQNFSNVLDTFCRSGWKLPARGQGMPAPAPVAAAAAMVEEDVVLGPNGRIIPIPDEVNPQRSIKQSTYN